MVFSFLLLVLHLFCYKLFAFKMYCFKFSILMLWCLSWSPSMLPTENLPIVFIGSDFEHSWLGTINSYCNILWWFTFFDLLFPLLCLNWHLITVEPWFMSSYCVQWLSKVRAPLLNWRINNGFNLMQVFVLEVTLQWFHFSLNLSDYINTESLFFCFI